jgi:hypothetical protein
MQGAAHAQGGQWALQHMMTESMTGCRTFGMLRTPHCKHPIALSARTQAVLKQAAAVLHMRAHSCNNARLITCSDVNVIR